MSAVEVDDMLERWDQTEPASQRMIVVRYAAHVDALRRALEREEAAKDSLLAATRALLADCPYAGDRDDCECGEFHEDGACVHTRAHDAIAKATGKD